MRMTDEESEAASSSSTSDSARDGPPPAKRAPMAELFGDLFPTEHGTSSQPFSQVVEEEVQHYRSVQSLSVESNPLVWWKDNEEQFPHLAKLAKRFLGIPATSVPSERVFSTAGDIVTAQRASLSPDNVDMMLFFIIFKKNLLNPPFRFGEGSCLFFFGFAAQVQVCYLRRKGELFNLVCIRITSLTW